ncbi:MAG: YjgP/YjgQ family permease [Chlorobiales bacterium]|jgi:lipopolysaccharide export system permease protein|nr:YjgP/YjgQ family permease [Chlorobiales bacterium]
MNILSRYILKSHIGPFLFGFITVVFVFTMQFLTRYLDKLVGKGLDFGVILELIFLQIAWMVVLAAPMAVLISTLMSFGNLTNSMEMTAIRASGISLFRIMTPVLIAAAAVTLFVERFNNIILPEANHEAKVLLMDISKTKPSFGLQENIFSDMIYGYTILARHTDEKTSDISGITIYDNSNPQRQIVITADSGSFEFTKDYRYLIMTLKHGEMHELVTPSRLAYRKIRFGKHRVVFESTGFGFERSNESSVSRNDREMSASSMLQICDSLSQRSQQFRQNVKVSIDKGSRAIFQDTLVHFSAAGNEVRTASLSPGDSIGILRHIAPDRRFKVLDRAIFLARNGFNEAQIQSFNLENNESSRNKYMVEVHKKYSIPFACLFFALVGVPLGVLARRGGFGVGAGLSLLFFLIYWSFLIGGEKLADRGLLSPGLAMWMGDIVLVLIGSTMLYIVTGRRLISSR